MKTKDSGSLPYYSLRLRLKKNDPDENSCAKILMAASNKKNKLISIMCSELIEKYGINPEDVTQQSLSMFINSYPYIKSMQMKMQPSLAISQQENLSHTVATMPSVPISSVPAHPVKDEKKTEPQALSDTEFDKDMSSNVLSAFNIS